MKKQRGDVFIELIVGLILISLMAIGGWAIKEYKCSNYSEMTGFATKYKLFDGCYVKTEKGWFLKEQLRDIPVSESK